MSPGPAWQARSCSAASLTGLWSCRTAAADLRDDVVLRRASSTATPPGGELHRALLDEPASGRSVVVSLTADPGHLSDVDAVVRPACGLDGDDRRRYPPRRPDGSFADAATPADQVTDLATLESSTASRPRRPLSTARGRRPGHAIQATTSDAAAAALGVHVVIGCRSSADRTRHARRRGHLRHLEVDPAAAWSRGDPLETGSTTGGTFTTRGLIVVEADLLGVAASNRVDDGAAC